MIRPMITPCFPSAPRFCACSLFALAVAIATPAAAQATDDAPSNAPCPDGSVPSADGACVASPDANGLAVQDAATSPDSADSAGGDRSEEHTSEPQSLMRNSHA